MKKCGNAAACIQHSTLVSIASDINGASCPCMQVAALKAQAEEQRSGHEVMLTGVRADLGFWQRRALDADKAKVRWPSVTIAVFDPSVPVSHPIWRQGVFVLSSTTLLVSINTRRVDSI